MLALVFRKPFASDIPKHKNYKGSGEQIDQSTSAGSGCSTIPLPVLLDDWEHCPAVSSFPIVALVAHLPRGLAVCYPKNPKTQANLAVVEEYVDHINGVQNTQPDVKTRFILKLSRSKCERDFVGPHTKIAKI